MTRHKAWKKVHRLRVLAALTLVTCTATISVALPQGNVIRGKVRDSSGRNMSQVIVQLETGNGQQINQTVTTNEGDFIFAGLPDTSYIVVISAPDFNAISEHVDFVRRVTPDSVGEQRTIEITLVSKAAAAPLLSNRTIAGQTIPKAGRDALDRAVKLSKDDKTEEAASAMREVIKAYPDYFDAHLMLAAELMKQSRLDDSIAEFEQTRRINPKDDRVYLGFGQVLMQQKKYALASQVFAEAARLNPSDPSLLLIRAGALIEYATAIDPSASTTSASERETGFTLAEKDLQKAFELSGKKLAAVHLQLARLYEKKADRARAADELAKYLKMAPDDKKADAIRAAIKTLRGPAAERKPSPPQQ